MLEQWCSEHEYDIVELHYNNAMIVPAEFNKKRLPPLSAEQAFQKGYLEKTDRTEKFGWIEEFENILNIRPEKKLEFINKYYSGYAGKYHCGL